MPTSVNYEEWLVLRIKTVIVFVIETFLIGVDFSFVFLTSWSYQKEMVKSDHPLLFYSLTLFASFIPGIFATWIISRILDRSRNVRQLILIVNFIVMAGNLVYAVPFSPWLPVVGRLLAGFGLTTRSVMIGEVSRSYSSQDLPRAVSYLGSAHVIGYVMGPCINFIFKGIHFHIGPLKVTYLNFPGILIAILFFVTQMIAMFTLSNLSKIYDLKKSEKSQDELEHNDESVYRNSSTDCLIKKRNDEDESALATERKKYNTTRITKELLTNVDTCLLLLLSFFQNYLECLFYAWVPLIVIEKLHWSVTSLGWINVAVAICAAGPCMLIFLCRVTSQYMFWIGVCAQICLVIAQVTLVLLRFFDHDNALDILLITLYCLSYLVLGVGEEVYLISTFAQLISSEYQMYAEGCRLIMYRIGGMAGLIMTAPGFRNMRLVSLVHIVIVSLCTVLMVLRRNRLKNPIIVVE